MCLLCGDNVESLCEKGWYLTIKDLVGPYSSIPLLNKQGLSFACELQLLLFVFVLGAFITPK